MHKCESFALCSVLKRRILEEVTKVREKGLIFWSKCGIGRVIAVPIMGNVGAATCRPENSAVRYTGRYGIGPYGGGRGVDMRNGTQAVPYG